MKKVYILSVETAHGHQVEDILVPRPVDDPTLVLGHRHPIDEDTNQDHVRLHLIAVDHHVTIVDKFIQKNSRYLLNKVKCKSIKREIADSEGSCL